MKTVLRSQELTCPSCIAKIEKAVKALPGVEEVKVMFSSGRIEVEHDPQRASQEKLAEAIRHVGYEAKVSAF